jgi:pimeloyl-ACP methyl ester carboxylesterase
MSKEENIRAGIAAAKSGDLVRAAAYFAQVVQEDPQSEQGWFLLGASCSDPAQREYCFRRVLTINPGHAGAKQLLERLSEPAPSAPAPNSQEPGPPAPSYVDQPPSPEAIKLEEPSDEPLETPAPGSPPPSYADQPPNPEAINPEEFPDESRDVPAPGPPAPAYADQPPGPEAINPEVPSDESRDAPAPSPLSPANTDQPPGPEAIRPEVPSDESPVAPDPNPPAPFYADQPPGPEALRPEVPPDEPRDRPAPFYADQPPGPETLRPEEPPDESPTAPAPSKEDDFREQLLDAQKPLPPLPISAAAPREVQLAAPPPRKRSRTGLIIALLFIAALIVCGVGVIFLYLNGQLTQLLSPVPVDTQTALLLPAQTATNGPADPTSEPTATLLPPTSLPTPRPTVAYTPVFQEEACAFDTPLGVDVKCGYVVVPEDRSGDPSHTIRLAVAVYRSFSDNPQPDPVIFLQGGPGAEAVQLSADAYHVLVEPFLAERDFIVFDQRGTGLSDPSLPCDELTKTYSQDIHGLIAGSTRELVYSTSFYSCQGIMTVKGIDLKAYTTLESAADVKDIIDLLGYRKVNLYGASYGTRLAQVIMRDYPDIVQTAVLDSVVPVETNLFSKYPDAIDSGLKTLFAGCALDPSCNAAYPDLETAFWDLIDKLDADPVTVTTSNYPSGTITETVTGTTVMNIILGSIKNSRFISTAPQSIYRFKAGDYSTLVIEQSGLPFMFDGISPGLFISMMCHEQILSTTPEELQNASDRQIIKEYAWLPFYGDAKNIFNTCKSWGASGPVAGENYPVISDIPSLIITGAYDPTTPPMYARQIAAQLSHSYYFEFPNQGHTPTASDSSGCAMHVVLQFLDDPSTEPDRTCLNELQPVDFVVPYTGEPPIELKNVRVGGVSLDVPSDWNSLDGGFYYRGNSPFDITEVGILRVPISSTDIEDWFSQKAYGYRGLDSALVPAGQRIAHGFTWKLFTSSSYGRPVDVAMADDGSWSNVVVMFCNQDEHDALYQTVFLSMLDSAN